MSSAKTIIVMPTRKMSREQLAEQAHFARRAGADVNRARQARKGFAKGGRAGGRRAAIASFG